MRSFPAVLLLLALSGCAGGSSSLHDPGEPTAAQQQQLKQAEAAYRRGENIDELRGRLAAEPVTAYWLTRMFVNDVMKSREGTVSAQEQTRVPLKELEGVVRAGERGAPSPEPLLAAAAGIKNPVEKRAVEQIVAMGAAAAPCLCQDLAGHRQAFVRQVGVDLLGRIGPAALPAMTEARHSSNPVARRTCAQAAAAMPPDAATFAFLRDLAGDPDFTVRSAALRAMARSGPEAGAYLRQALATEPDGFVRCAAAAALGSHRERAAADALIGYLERCKRDVDPRGEEAAQAALQELSATRSPRSAEAWRRWAGTFEPDRTSK